MRNQRERIQWQHVPRPEGAGGHWRPWLRFTVMIVALIVIVWFSGGPMLLVFLALGRKVEFFEFGQRAAREISWVGAYQAALLWAMAILSVLGILICIWEGTRLKRLPDQTANLLGRILIWMSVSVLVIGSVAVPSRMVEETRRFRPIYNFSWLDLVCHDRNSQIEFSEMGA